MQNPIPPTIKQIPIIKIINIEIPNILQTHLVSLTLQTIHNTSNLPKTSTLAPLILAHPLISNPILQILILIKIINKHITIIG